MSAEIKSIRIGKLLAYPFNPNSMNDSKFKKLVRNIERTGLYEPIVVRPHLEDKDRFQIINGHHRVKALQQLKQTEANCVIWDVDDAQTAILLTTLNRLAGSDIPARKIELLKKLNEQMKTVQLAKLLPQNAKQIERLTNLKLAIKPIKARTEQFAIPLVFFVSKHQQEIIENALTSIENPVSSKETTNARRRAAAITAVAEHFLAKPEDGRRENADLQNKAIMV